MVYTGSMGVRILHIQVCIIKSSACMVLHVQVVWIQQVRDFHWSHLLARSLQQQSVWPEAGKEIPLPMTVAVLQRQNVLNSLVACYALAMLIMLCCPSQAELIVRLEPIMLWITVYYAFEQCSRIKPIMLKNQIMLESWLFY